MKPQRIALLISGNGSNARNIIQYFSNHPNITIELVISSATNQKMEEFCNDRRVSFFEISNISQNAYLEKCLNSSIDWVVLAGFLKKIPVDFLEKYPQRIINIHPSLLPRFGGKGMYGKFVHQAVFESKPSFSGITIHLVNEEFDQGKVLAQFAFPLNEGMTALEIEESVRELEIGEFPKVIEYHIEQLLIE